LLYSSDEEKEFTGDPFKDRVKQSHWYSVKGGKENSKNNLDLQLEPRRFELY